MTKYLTADMIDGHRVKLTALWPGGRADKAPNVNMFVTKAACEYEGPESEEEQEDKERKGWMDQLQKVVSNIWYARRKPMVNRMIRPGAQAPP